MKWFCQLTSAVAYLHDSYILHRDLKLANIFLDSSNNVKLGDFGISKALSAVDPFTKSTVGTPYYISPEICLNRPYNHKSDIWSLGCILFELMYLGHAFEANTLTELTNKIVQGDYRRIKSGYSAGLKNILEDLLKVRAETRPSAREILGRSVLSEVLCKVESDEYSSDVKASTVDSKKKDTQKHKKKLQEALEKVVGANKLDKMLKMARKGEDLTGMLPFAKEEEECYIKFILWLAYN